MAAVFDELASACVPANAADVAARDAIDADLGADLDDLVADEISEQLRSVAAHDLSPALSACWPWSVGVAVGAADEAMVGDGANEAPISPLPSQRVQPEEEPGAAGGAAAAAGAAAGAAATLPARHPTAPPQRRSVGVARATGREARRRWYRLAVTMRRPSRKQPSPPSPPSGRRRCQRSCPSIARHQRPSCASASRRWRRRRPTRRTCQRARCATRSNRCSGSPRGGGAARVDPWLVGDLRAVGGSAAGGSDGGEGRGGGGEGGGRGQRVLSD